jgi:hypothetical protein
VTPDFAALNPGYSVQTCQIKTCDEVTQIARWVPFDYFPKSAQPDSIEGKHGFRAFKTFLTGLTP